MTTKKSGADERNPNRDHLAEKEAAGAMKMADGTGNRVDGVDTDADAGAGDIGGDAKMMTMQRKMGRRSCANTDRKSPSMEVRLGSFDDGSKARAMAIERGTRKTIHFDVLKTERAIQRVTRKKTNVRGDGDARKKRMWRNEDTKRTMGDDRGGCDTTNANGIESGATKMKKMEEVEKEVFVNSMDLQSDQNANNLPRKAAKVDPWKANSSPRTFSIRVATTREADCLAMNVVLRLAFFLRDDIDAGGGCGDAEEEGGDAKVAVGRDCDPRKSAGTGLCTMTMTTSPRRRNADDGDGGRIAMEETGVREEDFSTLRRSFSHVCLCRTNKKRGRVSRVAATSHEGTRVNFSPRSCRPSLFWFLGFVSDLVFGVKL